MTLLDRVGVGSLVAIDTAPWIYHFEQHLTYAPIVRPFFDALDVDILRAGSSSVVLAELLVGPLKQSRQDLAERYSAEFVDGPGFSVWEMTRAIVEQSARLRADYGLKTIDALHLASAIANAADVFLTNDRHFNRVKEIRVITLDEFVSP